MPGATHPYRCQYRRDEDVALLEVAAIEAARRVRPSAELEQHRRQMKRLDRPTHRRPLLGQLLHRRRHEDTHPLVRSQDQGAVAAPQVWWPGRASSARGSGRRSPSCANRRGRAASDRGRRRLQRMLHCVSGLPIQRRARCRPDGGGPARWPIRFRPGDGPSPTIAPSDGGDRAVAPSQTSTSTGSSSSAWIVVMTAVPSLGVSAGCSRRWRRLGVPPPLLVTPNR